MLVSCRLFCFARWLLVVFLCLGPAAASAAKAANEARWAELNAAVVESYKQGAYEQGVMLAEEARRVAEQAFGALDPRTMTSLNNLAMLYLRQGRYGKAEPLYQQALQLSRQVLGDNHPNTLTSLNNLAMLYLRQGRYGEAEPLYQQALQLSRQVLGDNHPDTLTSLNNLASLYHSQGRYGEAEPLFEQALQLSRQVLGDNHPDTLRVQLNSTLNMVNLDQPERAIGRLRQLEPHLLTWLGTELYSTESAAVRRSLVTSQASYQDVVVSLAVRYPKLAEAQALAASAVLRFKGLQAEEEAYLARLSRRGKDPRIQNLAQEIKALRSRLARAFHEAASDSTELKAELDPKELQKLKAELEAKELALGRLSRDYEVHLQVRSANVGDLQGALSDGTVLVEYRQYRSVDFKAGLLGAARWAAVLVVGLERTAVVDLGLVAPTAPGIKVLLAGDDQAAARALYDQLVAPLEPRLAEVKSVVLAPDGALNLVPFHSLRRPDGQRWAERQQLRVVQTGRDLLRPPADRPARGLLALGGIDFETEPAQVAAGDKATRPDAAALLSDGQGEQLRQRTEEAFRSGFAALPGSAEEAERVAQQYRIMRKDEAVEMWTGKAASEARLKALEKPPRVLHLATHGFYRVPLEPADQPMLLAGVVLAGANRGLRGERLGEDGLLYAVEAQDLNLEGTELVVLSACETAQGQIEQGEGVYGLVRALRTAGAAHVLVALRPVGDVAARDFMDRFYHHWLKQARSDPAAALQQTQRDYLAGRATGDWTPFILIGGTGS
jgi:CHAT domain-containing protein/tetratricopeptide (TPR) repeat protein